MRVSGRRRVDDAPRIPFVTDLSGRTEEQRVASLSRLEAFEILELDHTADRAAVKRAYRRLARVHHPDTGGDVVTFQRVQRAYERLRGGADLQVPRGQRPRQATRPSRAPGERATPPSGRYADDEVELAGVDWDQALPARAVPATRELVAVALARPHPGAVHPVTLRSRAPGSRLNRIAQHLDADLLADLTVEVTRDHRALVGHDVEVRVRAAARKVRRHIDRVPLEAGWIRERGSSWSQLRVFLEPSVERNATALRAADRTLILCERLEWPLPSWLLVPFTPGRDL